MSASRIELHGVQYRVRHAFMICVQWQCSAVFTPNREEDLDRGSPERQRGGSPAGSRGPNPNPKERLRDSLRWTEAPRQPALDREEAPQQPLHTACRQGLFGASSPRPPRRLNRGGLQAGASPGAAERVQSDPKPEGIIPNQKA